MKSYKLHKNKQGFTLIEIIVVLVIIGIVMMLAVPAVMKYSNEAAETKAKSQARAAYLAEMCIRDSSETAAGTAKKSRPHKL